MGAEQGVSEESGVNWDQLEAFGPVLIRLDLTVFLMGPDGAAQIGYTVSHGLEEQTVEIEAQGVIPLGELRVHAASTLHRLIDSALSTLAPF